MRIGLDGLTEEAGRLTHWYEKEQRDLPWRRTRDAYSIWVSETMLQQTRVETVIPYYFAFLDRFPTVAALADADFEEVAKLWQGLGYYSRARNLHKAAQVISKERGGQVPNDFETFRSLPGVGPYTAGAVMSIAFEKPTPAVDGNVLRVITRYLGIRDAIELPATKRAVTEHVESWIKTQNPRVFTQALMELGAMVCVPKRPRCDECPISAFCVARKENLTGEIPARKPKAEKRQKDVFAFWLEVDGHVLMQKRPEQGLLAGMWQLPAAHLEPLTGTADVLSRELARILREANLAAARADALTSVAAETRMSYAPSQGESAFAPLAEEKHVFTHLVWTVQVVRPLDLQLSLCDASELAPGFRFVPYDDIHQLVLPRVYEKLFGHILGKV